MKTQQIFYLKSDEKYLSSDIQATRNIVEEMLKYLQKIKSKESTVHDIGGLPWIIFEEYN